MAAVLRGVGPLLRNPSLCNAAHRRQLPLRLSFDRGVASKVFVGGLSFYTTEETLNGAFSPFGQVIEASIIMDKISERSKGFGFVTFASEEEAEKAIKEMNGKVKGCSRTFFRCMQLLLVQPPKHSLNLTNCGIVHEMDHLSGLTCHSPLRDLSWWRPHKLAAYPGFIFPRASPSSSLVFEKIFKRIQYHRRSFALRLNQWENSLEILNGRVIFVDNAKPRTPFQGSVPVARGPPTKSN